VTALLNVIREVTLAAAASTVPGLEMAYWSRWCSPNP